MAHASLTGANLHEPKGAASATANTVYAADGAGSGAWVDPNSLISSAAFSTGDVKASFKTTADSGFVLMNDGSIGDATSSATTRANADTEALFVLFWTNLSDTWAPVSGGRGATAVGDFNAHKRLTMPRALGRAMVSAGTGSGLTARTLGSYLGSETNTIAEANLPAHTHTFSATTGLDGAHSHTYSGTSSSDGAHTHFIANGDLVGSASTITASNYLTETCNFLNDFSYEIKGSATAPTVGLTSTASAHTHTYSGTTSTSATHTHTVSGTSGSTGSGTALNNMQPSFFVNFMVKL